jgi:predicted nuclease of predicted toxin-antitoxin system
MRLLLDESLPSRLRRSLPGHAVATVVEMGCGGVKNGRLLALASQQFDAFLTADKNLPYQRNLRNCLSRWSCSQLTPMSWRTCCR